MTEVLERYLSHFTKSSFTKEHLGYLYYQAEWLQAGLGQCLHSLMALEIKSRFYSWPWRDWRFRDKNLCVSARPKLSLLWISWWLWFHSFSFSDGVCKANFKIGPLGGCLNLNKINIFVSSVAAVHHSGQWRMKSQRTWTSWLKWTIKESSERWIRRAGWLIYVDSIPIAKGHFFPLWNF